MATEPRQANEPVIVYTVRTLLDDLREDFNARMDKLSAQLDDRVTVAVFKAMRTDLDLAIHRIQVLEEASSEVRGIRVTVGAVVRVGAWIVLAGLAALDLWVRTHGR